MIQNEINEIVEFCSKIINEEKIGSRYESNDIQKIWQLGNKITSLIKPLNISNLFPKLQNAHSIKRIRYDDRLYRAAITFRNYWSDESFYKEAIKNLNVWNKLRELTPICDRILSGASKYTREEVDKLIKECKDKTYTEVREIFIRFRKKEDKILEELGIDKYEFRDNLIEVADELHKIIEEEDIKIENELRRVYSSEQFREFRLLLSALQKEDVYLNKKWNKDIKKIVKKELPETDLQIGKQINELFTSINNFINNEKARISIRDEIPVTFIGNLSTYLRAIESDVNKQQYKKNKDILNKFIGKMGS